MKKILTIIFSGLTLASCVDTIILPDDKTVEEDFWKTQSDVDKMVRGAYTAFSCQGVQERLIVWNSRSDEYTINTMLQNSNLNQIYTVDMQTDNGYNNWGDFYTCINRCNQVIQKSPNVMKLDPNYLEGIHNNYVGQMYALRAMCYFYLIRAFHDVPLILQPYNEASQEMNVEQVAPGVVLTQIINDLEQAKNMVISSQDQSLSSKERACFFTQDAVLALLADVYLWKASVYRDMQAYTRCVELCEQIHINRKNAHGPRIGDIYMAEDDDYFLYKYNRYYNVFSTINDEAIFALAYDDNVGLRNSYYTTEKNKTDRQYFYTNTVYAVTGETPASGYVFLKDKDGNLTDVRCYESVFSYGSATEKIGIRKYVAEQGLVDQKKAENGTSRDFSPYAMNFNIYRITDIMTMQAEALVQQGRLILEGDAELIDALEAATTIDDSLTIAEKIRETNDLVSKKYVKAAHLAQIVSERASTSGKASNGIDSTKVAVSAGKLKDEPTDDEKRLYVSTQVANHNTLLTPTATKDLELLIMAERARELCFEGKRWYDMMRYNYRHTEVAANYDATLFSQPALENNEVFLSYIKKKYSGNAGVTVTMRLATEPYLYMPIYKNEMDVNSKLIQNPVYKDNETSSKNK